MEFTEDSTLGEIMDVPGGEEVLVSHDVPCPSCPMMAMELDELTIGEIADQYGLDLDEILQALNDLEGQ